MIDLHALILPGTPGGADSVVAAADQALAEAADGVAEAVCAPPLPAGADASVLGRWDAVRAEVQEQIALAGGGVDLLGGAVIPFDMLATAPDELLQLASPGRNGRWLLASLPEVGWPLDLGVVLTGLEIRGYGVVLVGPERADAVQLAPDRMRDPVGRGALVLVDAASLSGLHGPRARTTARALLRANAVHLMGTGAAPAGAGRLTDGLHMASRMLRCEPTDLTWMVQDGPAGVLEAQTLRPPRITRPRENPEDAPPDSRAAPRPRHG